MMFPIERDDEFYVFLKSCLPPPFRIQSEPSPSYYSEWMFRYILYKGDKLLEIYQGDFRTIEKGSLVREAKKMMANILKEQTPC